MTWQLRLPPGIAQICFLVFVSNSFSQGVAAPLRFLGNAQLPPIVWSQDTKAEGVAVDLVNAAADEAGLVVQVQGTDWQKAQEDLVAGKADALIQINATAQRLTVFDFSDPLLQSNFHIFRRSRDADIGNMDSLSGKRVGVEAAGFPMSYLKEHGQASVVVVQSWGQAFDMLHAGEIDAVLVDRWVGEYELYLHKVHDVVRVDPPIASLDSHIAVRRGNAFLLAKINRGLRAIDQNGTREAILEKWRAKEVVYMTRESLNRGIVWSVSGVATLLVLLCAWLYRQRQQLRELNRDFVIFLENTPDFIYFKDVDSRFRFCSQTIAKITGHHSWRDLRGKHDLEVFPDDVARIYHEEELPVFRDGAPLLNRVDPYIDEHQQAGWVNTNKWPTFDSSGKVNGIFGISRIVTEQIRLEQENERLLSRQMAIIDNELIATFATKERQVSWANPAFEKMFGYERGELNAESTRCLFVDDDAYEAFGRNAYGALATHKSYRTEQEFVRKDGCRLFAEASGSALLPASDEYLWCFIDVTLRKSNEEKVKQLAFHDELTNLANRRMLTEHLERALASSKRSGRYAAIMFMDLDNFKSLNDSHGHEVGDQLLIEVASRLAACVREIDTIARFGGDEFVVMLGELDSDLDASRVQAQAVAEKIRLALRQVYVLSVRQEGQADSTIEHLCTVSIGVVLFNGHSGTQDDVLKRADAAMYQAKNAGRDIVKFYAAIENFPSCGQ
jgi:diguanylate cyclase (GGDEF)-like protein/PAS domain S-box-containing protein